MLSAHTSLSFSSFFLKLKKGFVHECPIFICQKCWIKISIEIHYLYPAISAHAPQASFKRLIFEPTNTHCTNIVNKGKRNHEDSHHKEKGATKTSLFRKIYIYEPPINTTSLGTQNQIIYKSPWNFGRRITRKFSKVQWFCGKRIFQTKCHCKTISSLLLKIDDYESIDALFIIEIRIG